MVVPVGAPTATATTSSDLSNADRRSRRARRWHHHQAMQPISRAVFLDRDGTLIVEREYLRDPAQVELIPGVPHGLQRLQTAGFHLVLVTNQSGIGRGYFTEADMHRVNRRMLDLLAPCRVYFDRIYFAPEAPDQPSLGRKPSPHFLFAARDDLGVDLTQSYMVGDKLLDLECGWNAGVCESLLVRTGYGAATEAQHPQLRERAVIVDNLEAAAAHICGHSQIE